MAEYLIAAQDIGGFTKGDIARVGATGRFYGTKEGLPNFVKVKVVEHLLKTHKQYDARWKQAIEFEVLNHNESLDGYRIRAYSAVPGLAGEANLTREKIERHLTAWNAVVQSVSVNEVVFDFSIYGAVTSARYWMMTDDIGDFVFSEVSYNQTTGEHIIDLDFSGSSRNPTSIERKITQKGHDVLSNDGQTIRFSILRDEVFPDLKSQIQSKIGYGIKTRRYYFGSAVVDDILSQGGEVTATDAEFQTYIKDKLNG